MTSSVSRPAPKTGWQGKTALVVDEVEDMLDLLEIAFGCAEFGVVRASSVAEALRVFDQCPKEIDLLMTEVRLGQDSGLELARRLLASKPSLRVLVTSGVARDRRAVQLQPGLVFLPKPFSTSELRQKLALLFPTAQAH